MTADLPAIARPVTDESERRRIMAEILAELNQPGDLEAGSQAARSPKSSSATEPVRPLAREGLPEARFERT